MKLLKRLDAWLTRKEFNAKWRKLGQYEVLRYKDKGVELFRIRMKWRDDYWMEVDKLAGIRCDTLSTLAMAEGLIRSARYEQARMNRREHFRLKRATVVSRLP